MSAELREKPLVTAISEYLENGGLFNPESMEHQTVRDLLILCREALMERDTALAVRTEEAAQIVKKLFDASDIDSGRVPLSQALKEIRLLSTSAKQCRIVMITPAEEKEWLEWEQHALDLLANPSTPEAK